MALPFTIVTIIDADDDEFPVRLEGDCARTVWNEHAAISKLEEQVENGDFLNPTYPLSLAKWERP